VERRLAAGLVEGASQYLAVYGDDALAGLRKLAREPLKAAPKTVRDRGGGTPGESVVARQSLFELQELRRNASFSRANNSISEAYLAAAKDRAQRNDHDLDEIMKPGVAGARILQISKQAAKPSMRASNRRVLDAIG